MEGGENGNGEEVGLLVLEAKSLRPFKTKDEYLYAMKEDLAEWFKCLYENILINAENFLEVLETGVLLCQHANEVRKFTEEQKKNGGFQMKSNFVRDIQIPQYDVQFRVDVKPETFLARDNVSNFITWTVKMGIPEVLRFETDDLVLRKNERSVVLCLLEVARVGAKFGMLAPTIVQMEEEIDEEIATGEPPPQIKTCDIKSLDEMVRELVGRCTCPVQFPIIKVGEGKYKIGDSQTLVFVRILRKHVMIRVGGGWDTLEHYLDRHDPCRCNFQGHRQGGRGPTTPRRSSVSAVTQSVPTTPRVQRKLSVTSPGELQSQISNLHIPSTGPNSKKLPLNRTFSQPDSSITSPGTSSKAPSFSKSGHSAVVSKNSASNVSMSKTKHSSVSSNSSPSVVKSGSINQRRSASPAPGLRRSQSPAPEAINRLKSPSPAPSSSKSTTGARTQSVPASVAKRCASPVKQITLSDVRSSREGKAGLHVLRRQASIDQSSNDADSDVMDAKSGKEHSDTNIAIDKISTMSLGEFKSLLNSALSVPNGTDSQCSSDSPRSQSSVDSFRNNKGSLNKTAPTNKSASSYRPGHLNRNVASTSKSNTLPRTKSATLDCSSSGYSTSSVSSDKAKKSPSSTSSPSSTYARSSALRPRTPSGDSPNANRAKAVSSRSSMSNKQAASSYVGQQSVAIANQLKSSGSAYKTRSQNSLDSEASSVRATNTSTIPSRSSSQSSFKSYDSYNETDSNVSNGLRRVETDSSIPRHQSDLDSPSVTDYPSPLSNGHGSSGYQRSNSYTPHTAQDNKGKWAEPRTELRANSEPKEVVKTNSIDEDQPLNVGYASFSYNERNGFNHGTNFDEELSKIESELKKYEDTSTEHIEDKQPVIENKPISVANTNTQAPVRRPSTPSLIPRPSTPKMTRKLSIPACDDNYSVDKKNESRGRPPTPKKSNIIAKSPSSNVSVRAADSSKEKSYKEIFQSKRSMTPGPGNVTSPTTQGMARRSSTPGPSMSRTTSLSSTSATTTRARLNQTLDQQKKDIPLSVYDESGNQSQSNRSRTSSRSSTAGASVRAQSTDSRSLIKQRSVEQPETVIMVNRSDDGHSLTVNDQVKPKIANRPTVLARARTDDARARTQTRSGTGISRQRPQSVEPRQLIRSASETNKKNETLAVRSDENGQHSVYDRTQEWVQTAAEQTSKVQKTKVMKQVNPKVRRAMTPNSFHLKIDQEEPRSFDEIKAALTLPINGLSRIEIDADNLDAPPEDPEMYATMEKLFNELRKQELKASVNETPGSNVVSSRSSKSKSKSSSSMNDEEASLDSNKNIKQKKKLTLATNSASDVTSPSLSQKKMGVTSQTPTVRQTSRTSSSSSAGVTPSTPRSTQPSTPRSTQPSTPRSTHPSTPRSTPPRSIPPRPASPSLSRTTQPARPASPRTMVSSQPPKPSVQRPASPRTTSNPPRPASPRTFQSPIPASPRNVPPASPRTVSTTNKQPPRPASTPPRPSTPVGRKTKSRASDDIDGGLDSGKDTPVAASSLLSKIKEIIKVKPRKDKAEGVKQKSRIPAPKSLAGAGKSKSFSNLSSINSVTLPNSKPNGRVQYSFDETEMNGFELDNEIDEINGGLNVTLSGRSEAPKPKLSMPLTTGRATVIRKESMEKNKNHPRLTRAVSVERNMGGLKNNFQYYEDGEYV